jgi:hypothetical protein
MFEAALAPVSDSTSVPRSLGAVVNGSDEKA